MSDDNNKIFGCIGLMAVFIFSLIIASFMNGWALSLLWGWFIAPILNVPKLRIIDAIGISLVVTFLTQRVNQHESNKNKDWIEYLFISSFVAILYPILAVGIGWIVSQFI